MNAVCERLLEMGTLVDGMIQNAVKALLERNDDLALIVMRRDDEADDLDFSIEEQCLRLLWKQQPVAADLRVVGTALKAITDLERIGDHAVDIARIALELNRDVPAPDVMDVPRMADAALTVLHDALAAFDGPKVEVHISNPNAREPWRHTSVVAPVATGSITGFSKHGYDLAIQAVAARLGL